ncbi:type A2 lantipeptide [Streptomyces sp. NPDC059828]|uniref:type A2 lantipeptide n=1 Tax=Streptomyces sp. NPDC059828 TaxID=3346965 RepID=UPI003667FFE2
MDFTPQVETAEISDADLDNVSGGLHSAVVTGVAGNVTSTLDSVAPVSGLIGTAVGTVEGATGLNTGAVTGLVAGL